MKDYVTGRRRLMGCSIRPGFTPGGFTEIFPPSDGKTVSVRQEVSDPRYGRHRDFIEAADRMLEPPPVEQP